MTSKSFIAKKNLPVWLIIGYCFAKSTEVLFPETKSSYPIFLIVLSGIIFLTRSLRSVIFYKTINFSNEHKLLSAFFIWSTLAVIAQLTTTTDVTDQFGRNAHDHLIQSLYGAGIWILAGASASLRPSNAPNKIAIIIPSTALLFMVLETTNYGLAIEYSKLYTIGSNEEPNHILLSENLIIICLFSYGAVKSFYRPVMFIVIAYLLFAGGGRSSFLIGLLSIIGHELIFGKKSLAVSYVSLTACGLLMLLFYVDSEPLSRMLLKDGLTQDDSFIGRYAQFEQGLSLLPEQALWGDVSLIAVKNGSLGTFMHNLFSAWQYYGALGLIFFASIIYAANKNMIARCRSRSQTYSDSVFSIILIYATLSVLFTKSFTLTAFWLAAGYWMSRSGHLSQIARSQQQTVAAHQLKDTSKNLAPSFL